MNIGRATWNGATFNPRPAPKLVIIEEQWEGYPLAGLLERRYGGRDR